MSTIEQKTASMILQMPDTFVVGKKKYRVAKPSTATLIEVSAAISKLPAIKFEKDNIVIDVLHNAKNCSAVGEVVAALIVGSKGMHKPIGRIIRSCRLNRIAHVVMEQLTPSELQQLTTALLAQSGVGDFFGLIAFLNEANLLKATKATTTASGQPSEPSSNGIE